jgi:acyl-CoA hydrolase
MNEISEAELKDFEHVTSHLVMSADLNAANLLFGGKLILWVDEAAAMFIMKKLKTPYIVTKKITELIFDNPTHLGDIIDILFRTSKVGRTSFTAQCFVVKRNTEATGEFFKVLECEVVFVRVDEMGRPKEHGYKI